MLPDFPLAKEVFWKHLHQAMRNFMHSRGVLAVIKEKPVHEGNSTSIKQSGQAARTQSPQMLAQELHIDRERLIVDGPGYIVELFAEASVTTQRDATKMVYDQIDFTCKDAGTTLDAGGKPLDLDMYLQLLEKMEIDFDQQGNAHLPTLVTSSVEIVRRVQTWSDEPESKAKIDALLEKKRTEWRDRESNRKLVD